VIWGRFNGRVMDPDWLGWVKRLQAVAQEGLTYATDGYDLDRYERLRGLAAEILAAHSTGDLEEAHALLALEAAGPTSARRPPGLRCARSTKSPVTG
jgi:hypothetical protein